MKGPWYSEGFVSTILACVCHTTRRGGGWASAEESPGLSCYCTSPPRETLTFPAQTTFCPVFISGGEEGQEKLKQAVGKFKKKKAPVDTLPSSLLPRSVSFFFPPCPSRGILAVGEGWVECWSSCDLARRVKQARHSVCRVPPCSAVKM